MPDNQVDGIKKLSKEEIKRSRNIVLDTIGEKAPAKDPQKEDYLINKQNLSKRVDGLNVTKKAAETVAVPKSSKKSLLSLVEKSTEKNKIENKTPAADKSLDNESADKIVQKIKPVNTPNIFERLKLKLHKRHEVQKRIREEKRLAKEKENALKKEKRKKEKENEMKEKLAQKELQKKKRKEIEAAKKLEDDKRKIVENKVEEKKEDLKNEKPQKTKSLKEIISITGYDMIKKQGVDFVADLKAEHTKEAKTESKDISKDRKRQAAAQKAEEKKKLAEEKERKKILEKQRKKEFKEKQREEKTKQKLLKKEKLKEIIKTLNRRIASISKRSMYITTLIFVSGMVIYFLVLISVVRFDIDNKITRSLAEFIPVPAYISGDGIIEYYKYKDIKNSMSTQGIPEDELESEIKMKVVRSLVLEKLINKYNLLVNTDEGVIPQITTQLAFDIEVNLVPINRIKKIKQLIEKQGDFVRVATKYGDNLGQITLDNNDSNEIPYFDDVKNLELGEVSDMVITADGYYIFKCFDKDSSSIALSYVFIKSNTLESFIDEEVKGYRLISFVD